MLSLFNAVNGNNTLKLGRICTKASQKTNVQWGKHSGKLEGIIGSIMKDPLDKACKKRLQKKVARYLKQWEKQPKENGRS